MGEIKSYLCRFCGATFPIISGVTHGTDYIEFAPKELPDGGEICRVPPFARGTGMGTASARTPSDSLNIIFFRCPSCKKTIVVFRGASGSIKDLSYTYPLATTQYPEYVPQIIRTDYTEAASIAELSPKASATLARRCLQSIIRDYWQITPAFWDTHKDIRDACHVRKDKTNQVNLFQEIKAVELIGEISEPIIAAFRQLKDIGNIGAHPENDVSLIVDVEQGEAEILLKLIDLIIQQTYIQRNMKQELLKQIDGIAAEKAEKRGDHK